MRKVAVGIYGDNFYSWCDRQYCRNVSDEETMAEHDRHYHKDGFNPDTDNCERREEEKKSDSVDSKDPPITEEYLKKRFGMKVQPFSIDIYGKEAENFTTDSFREGWKRYATEPSDEERKRTIHLVGKVLCDIEDSFGCKVRVDNLLLAKFRPYQGGYGIGGCSLPDRIAVKESLMAIATNAPEWGGETYGHKDFNKNKEDMIRHELGHVLTTQSVRDEFDKIVQLLIKRYGMKGASVLVQHSASQYAVRDRRDFEFIAEIFSRITAKDFKRTFIPQEIIDFVKHTMLGAE